MDTVQTREAIMVRMMCMESLEWQNEEREDPPQDRSSKEKVTDLNDADVDAFLRKMYALQQC